MIGDCAHQYVFMYVRTHELQVVDCGQSHACVVMRERLGSTEAASPARKTPVVKRGGDTGNGVVPARDTQPKGSSQVARRLDMSSPAKSQVKDSTRLCSEVRRFLLRSTEHAMTVGELVEAFEVQEDPAQPSVAALLDTLKAGKSGQFQVRLSSVADVCATHSHTYTYVP